MTKTKWIFNGGVFDRLKLEHELASVAYDLYHACLHGWWIQASVDGAGHDLVQKEGHQVLVGNETPEVDVQVVRVYLHLLKAEPVM